MSRKAEKIAFQTLADSGYKKSVRVASTANISDLSGFQTIDGVTLEVNDRILLKDQTNGEENGIYFVKYPDASRNWERAEDMDFDSEVEHNTIVFVEEGTVGADSGWMMTNDGDIEIGTTNLVFKQMSADAFVSTATEGNILMADSTNTLVKATPVYYETNVVSATDTFTLSNAAIGNNVAAYVDGARVALASVSGTTVVLASALGGGETEIAFDYFYAS